MNSKGGLLSRPRSQAISPSTIVANDDTYEWLARREKRAPNPPKDLGAAWERLTPLEKAPEAARSRIGYWAASKGADLATLERMEVRYRVNRHGGIVVAYSVCCAATEKLSAGTIVGIKYRDLDPEAPRQKFCEPGTRLASPALPSLYGRPEPERCFVCEGESDAAWLLARGRPSDAVFCLHGGAALFCSEWISCLPEGAEVFVATDNDWDRHGGNIGEELAQQLLAAIPGSRRVLPPFPAKDWAEVAA